MEVLQLSVNKRRLNSSSNNKSGKLRSRSVDNNWRRGPGKLRLSSRCNLRIINKRNIILSSSRSVDNSRKSPGKLRLSSSCNMRISNKRNNSLSSRRRSAGNLPLSSRCNKYNSLYNRRSPGNLHCRRGTRLGNLCLNMRFLTVLMGQNRIDQNTSLVHAYVMEHTKDKLAFAAKVDQDYFKGGCSALMLNIEFSSVFNLITLASVDVIFMRLWTL
jgi:hypothetical protein